MTYINWSAGLDEHVCHAKARAAVSKSSMFAMTSRIFRSPHEGYGIQQN